MYRRFNPKYARQQEIKQAKQNKYHAQKVTAGGEKFDSEKEYARYLELQIMEKAGLIEELERQVRYELIPAQHDEITGKVLEKRCCYIADFKYWDCERRRYVVEDVKGYRRGNAYAVFAIKRKLMLQKYGIQVEEV